MQGTVALFSFHACCPRVVLEEWMQPTELVGGNNSDEVLNDLLGREIAESLKQAVEAILDEEVGELGEYVRPVDVTNFAATVSSNQRFSAILIQMWQR